MTQLAAVTCFVFSIGLVGVFATGCKKEAGLEERCWKAVRHMTDGVMDVPKEAKAKEGSGEYEIIEAIVRGSAEACIREGLSPAQAECIMNIKGVAGMKSARDCPALKEKLPTWLRLPPAAKDVKGLPSKPTEADKPAQPAKPTEADKPAEPAKPAAP